jgi:hypothetical protein
MQTVSSGTLIGWKSGQMSLYGTDRMEGARLRTLRWQTEAIRHEQEISNAER